MIASGLRRRLGLVVLVLALVGLGGGVWLAVEMGALGALSLPPPFSKVVRTEVSPCLLALTGDAGAVDRAALGRVLRSYSASVGLRPDDAGGLSGEGGHGTETFSGSGSLSLVVSAGVRHVSVQLFKDAGDREAYVGQVRQAVAAFGAVGLRVVGCE